MPGTVCEVPESMSAESASVARGADGQDPVGTLNTQSATFAIMEFLENGDSNQAKSLWKKYGAKDVSALWGDKDIVPTFKSDASQIARWPEFQKGMVGVEADWYYVSGHHARQRAHDDEGIDPVEFVNTTDGAGFFNEPYHTGTWDQATADDPEKGRSDKGVFMTTTQDPPADGELGPEDNPLFTQVHENAKGVLLVGCNSLVFRMARVQWSTYFPNAVVIGLVSRESASILKIMKLFDKYGKAFFDDPTSVDPHDLMDVLLPKQTPMDRLAVMTGGTLYTRNKKGEIHEWVANEGLTKE